MSNALSNVNSLRHLAFTAYSLSFVIVVVGVSAAAGDATATVFVFIALMLVGDSKAALTLMTNTLVGQEIR